MKANLLISELRMPFMAISILMVVMYHAFCSEIPLGFATMPSRFGLIGVDAFMFLSGYGLCSSIEKHSLLNFYKRRIIKIIPSFLILVIAVQCAKDLMQEENNTSLIYSITTVAFLNGGGLSTGI